MVNFFDPLLERFEVGTLECKMNREVGGLSGLYFGENVLQILMEFNVENAKLVH